MVQKSKGGKKCRSVIAGKKAKNEMKYHRKKNYKKKVVKKVECSVCMEEVVDTSDNTITCGKVNHSLCMDCKMKCEDCPMCRSHKVQKPISQDVNLRVVQAIKKKDKKIDRINVSGLSIGKHDLGDGIYEKIDIDKNGYSIYKHESMERYIYKCTTNHWALHNILYGEEIDELGITCYADECLFRKNGKKDSWLLWYDDNWHEMVVSIRKLK